MGKVIVRSATTKHPISCIGVTAGVCWNAPTNNQPTNYKRGLDCLASNHGRTLEYVNLELILEGWSARVIREFYTHIGGAPSRLQESTRYCEWKGGLWENVCLPESFDHFKESNQEAWSEFEQAFTKLVSKMEEAKVPKEDIAGIYPLNMQTKVVVKGNLRWLISMAGQRLCSRALPEYQKLMKAIKEALSAYSVEWETICKDYLVAKCEQQLYCCEKKSCGRYPSREKVKEAVDKLRNKENV